LKRFLPESRNASQFHLVPGSCKGIVKIDSPASSLDNRDVTTQSTRIERAPGGVVVLRRSSQGASHTPKPNVQKFFGSFF
jgi:hypothetical protein